MQFLWYRYYVFQLVLASDFMWRLKQIKCKLTWGLKMDLFWRIKWPRLWHGTSLQAGKQIVLGFLSDSCIVLDYKWICICKWLIWISRFQSFSWTIQTCQLRTYETLNMRLKLFYGDPIDQVQSIIYIFNILFSKGVLTVSTVKKASFGYGSRNPY